MNIWIIIFVITIAASLAGLVYMVWAVRQFPLIDKLAGGNKKISSLISFVLIALVFCIIMMTMSMTNAIVVLLFAIGFRLTFGLLGRIIRLFHKEPYKTYWQGCLSLLACAVYLTAGYIICHHVVATEYDLGTDKEIGKLRIAMFADSHMGTTFDATGFSSLMDDMMKHSPDIILIVGDFVDDSTKKADMIMACEALGRLEPKYGVWYVFGNHDRGYYRGEEDDFDESDLIDELEKNHVHVLVDEAELIDGRFYLVGREDAGRPERMEIGDLVSGLDPDKYTIVLDHQPTDYDNEAAVGADLVLSGHTHGGQVFPVTYVGEWFDINDRTYGYERRANTDFIVTSGISDWEILFKTASKAEYVIIDVIQERR
ncbi:MAG: metallophosphoesterase [Lachnospiraceae bacterium]|nr:metallophosphoesterase [Lachnospiraceae bacterium]